MNEHYSKYFSVKKDYSPCMSISGIQETPEKWLDYYPHKGFIEILRKLLELLDGGNQSLWIAGAYGTGKTHCVLVLQKLFNDDESRVLKYFSDNQELSSLSEVKKSLLERRKEKTLVVFDSGSAGVNATDQFLVRIEKAINLQLEKNGYKIPPRGNIEKIKERIKDEDDKFFKTRDTVQSRLSELNPNIKDYSDLEKRLDRANEDLGILLSDISVVFRERNIYLDVSPESLKKWINDILELNGIARIIFIWDEFSEFMDKNKAQLTTMQEVIEISQTGKFFFIPVTHLAINAFVAAGSESAIKIADRFIMKDINMPMGTALKLAAKALNINQEMSCEWGKEREFLWSEVKLTAEKIKSKIEDIENINDFKELLPIHPMTAIVLKQLSGIAASNQRSIFDFMAKSQEFQNFINYGGVAQENKQFLTIDYLWGYFVEERHELVTSQEVFSARSDFLRHKEQISQEEDRRVLKAVLLLKILSDKWDKNFANDIFAATIDNMKLSFKGDGIIDANLDTIIKNLESEHCFNVVNDKIETFGTMADEVEVEKRKEKLQDEFSKNILEEYTQKELILKIDYNYGDRYDIRSFGIKETIASNIKYKDTFGKEGNKILIQFVLAKNKNEQLSIADKIRDVTKQLSDFRVIFVSLDTTFCSQKSDLWNTYIEQLAKLELSNNSITKGLHERQILEMREVWKRQIFEENRKLTLYFWNSTDKNVKNEDISWMQLKEFLLDRTKEWFKSCVDYLSDYNRSAFTAPNSLRLWAEAGILLSNGSKLAGAQKTLTTNYLKKGITGEYNWFDENPQHPLTKMRNFCKKQLEDTIGHGTVCSIRKIYTELQRPPYGLLNVSYSAFVLGFVLKEFLTDERNLQWTNNTDSRKLDVDSLSEIIDSVVKDNGENKIKNEKLIRVISREDKAFIDFCQKIFGMVIDNNVNIEALLKDLPIQIEKICNGVPLWVLPEYIRDQQIDNASVICEIIEKLCSTVSISSKGDVEERRNNIKAIGELVLHDYSITNKISNILKSENIENAYRRFVDVRVDNLKLKEMAVNAEDYSCEYYNIVKSKFAQTASWLWKPQDIEPILNEVALQYDIIITVRELTGVSGFLPFDGAIERLKKAIFLDNKIPLKIWELKYPMFGRIFELLQHISNGEEVVNELASLIKKQCYNDLKKIFFDLEQKEQIAITQKLLQDVWNGFSEKENREIYSKFGNWANDSEDDFKDRVLRIIDEYKGKLESVRRKKLWLDEQPRIREKVEKISERKAKDILLKLAEKDPQEILRLLEE